MTELKHSERLNIADATKTKRIKKKEIKGYKSKLLLRLMMGDGARAHVSGLVRNNVIRAERH